ncbi:MAG: LytTR family DNA-binding domain-containing protein [Bacteroidia bacterium]
MPSVIRTAWRCSRLFMLPFDPDEKYLALPAMHGFIKIEKAAILYCEPANKQTIFIIAGTGARIVVNKSLKECEEKLAANGFFRIHRLYLVNLAHICEYHKGKGGILTMTNKDTLKVAPERKKHSWKYTGGDVKVFVRQ